MATKTSRGNGRLAIHWFSCRTVTKREEKNSLINFKYDLNKPSQVVKYGSFYVHIALGGDS